METRGERHGRGRRRTISGECRNGQKRRMKGLRYIHQTDRCFVFFSALLFNNVCMKLDFFVCSSTYLNVYLFMFAA